MAIASSASDIVAQAVPRTPIRLVPVKPAAPKPKLFVDRLIEAGCEVIALAGQAGIAIVRSRQPDAIHDRHLSRVVRLAHEGAADAEHQLCGHDARFRAIVREAVAAQVADHEEDSWLEKAAAFLAQIATVCRAANRSLQTEGTKRGWWR